MTSTRPLLLSLALIALVLNLPSPIHAQTDNSPIAVTSVDPTGKVCALGTGTLYATTGGLFTCQGGVFALVSSGNLGTVTHTAGALTSGAIVIGNGAADLKVSGVSIDASNNITGAATITAGAFATAPSAVANMVALTQGTVNTPVANSVGHQAPTSVATGYLITDPATNAAGFVRRDGATPSVESVSLLVAADLPLAHVTINTGSDPCPTGSHCAFGTTYKSGYVFNQQTATDRIYIDLPTAAAGLQWCIKNSVVGGTGAAVTGIITVKAQTGDYINNDGTIGSSGGVLSSSGAAGDGACFVASNTNHWEVFAGKGTWLP